MLKLSEHKTEIPVRREHNKKYQILNLSYYIILERTVEPTLLNYIDSNILILINTEVSY